jgi:hypothetical protein
MTVPTKAALEQVLAPDHLLLGLLGRPVYTCTP